MKPDIYLKFCLILILFVCLFPLHANGQVSSSANINLQVTSECNNNGICESNSGENTQTCPSDCNNQAGVGGGIINFEIGNIVVSKISQDSAVISWQNTNSAICQIYLGQTPDYGKMIVFETQYLISHSADIKNLDSSTHYNFKITCQNLNNKQIESSNQQFSTLAPINIVLPSNVSGLKTTAGDQNIFLEWTDSPDADFIGVKIVRKTDFYPLNANDGTIVYEGSWSSFEDTQLVNGTMYYYAVFAADKNISAGGPVIYSSGALASGIPYKENVIPTQSAIPTATASPAPSVTPLPLPVPISVTIDDFIFSVNGQNIPIINGKTLEVSQNTLLNISADCRKFADAKTVLINVKDSQQTASFILKQEGQSNFCNLSFMVPKSSGSYPLSILILNYKNEIITEVDADLKVLAQQGAQFSFNVMAAIEIILAVSAIIFFAVWFLRRRGRKQIMI